MNPGTVAVVGQPTFAHCSEKSSEAALLMANKTQQQRLSGTTCLPIALYILLISPNDHPITAQVSQATMRVARKSAFSTLHM